MFPICKHNIPNSINVTYYNFICNIRIQKKETDHLHLTYGGYFIDYPSDTIYPAVSILDTKIHINGTISDSKYGACYLVLDIKNFYLGTTMFYFHFIQVHHTMIPKEVIDEYILHSKTDGHVYFKILRVMCDLK